MKKLLSLMILASVMGRCFAEMPANYLWGACDNQFRAQECQAFFEGFTQGFVRRGKITVTRNVSAQTLANMFVKHMKEYPQDGDMPVGDVITSDLIYLKLAVPNN